MNFNQVMTELKRLGTALTIKIYRRHGAEENFYGVSFANLKVLQNELKTDQALAEQLWETGNVDALCLATMVADPVKFPASLATAGSMVFHFIGSLTWWAVWSPGLLMQEKL